jgi:hypothetical protein
MKAIVKRLVNLFAYWGLIEHPYGREYVRERYTITGRRLPDRESTRDAPARESGGLDPRVEVALVTALVVLLSAVGAGVLLLVN